MERICPACGAGNEVNTNTCAACDVTLPLLPKEREDTSPEIKLTGLPGPEDRGLRTARLPGQRHLAVDTKTSASSPATAPATAPGPGLRTTPRPTQAAAATAARGDDGPGHAFPVPEDAPAIPADASRLRIGYSQDNDLVIPRPQVSGFHAVLARVDGRLVLEDLGSTNGTSVNHHPIQRAWVRPGDRIGLGSYDFVLDAAIAAHLDAAPVARTERMVFPAEGTPGVEPVAVIIGRDPEVSDIALDAPQISRRHAELHRLGHGRWRLRDLGSANGTFVNDRNVRVEEALVSDEDVLFLGSYRFPIKRIYQFTEAAGQAPGRAAGAISLPMDLPIITIGRGPENDVVLDQPQVSRHHARLVRRREMAGAGWVLEDLGSANGTFVDGLRVTRLILEDAQQVSFGSYAVRLDMARGLLQKSYRGDILLQAENLVVDVRDGERSRRILDEVGFTAFPTEIVGIMGPSGSGKTTLLMSLMGIIRPSRGRTLLNNDDLVTHYDRYRGAIGYVPQEDIIHRELTVYEALYYTAKLRLPADTDDREIHRRIDRVLVELEIGATRNVIIGTPERKGISGGQRKRVNLALELLTEPSLLCLDEPTSGLASEDTLNVIRLLRKLADGGRTILMTIHQPSLQAYRLIDNVLYLADGEQTYYGPTYPDSILYFHPEVQPHTPEAEALLADPGSCMRPIVEARRAGEPMETFAARYRQSRYHEEFVEQRRKNRGEVRLTGSGRRQRPRFSLRQLATLCRRYTAIKLKDRLGSLILLLQAPIIAILLDLVFIAKTTSGVMSRLEFMPFALFLMVISAVWFGCSNAAREIVGEQAIYRRERMVNLSIGAYVLSKFVVLGGLCLLQVTALLTLTYFVLDFTGNPLLHLGLLWLCAMAGVGLGLMLSAVVRTTEAASALVPLLLIPQVILGGAIMPIHQMSPVTWSMSQAMVSRWGFEGALHTEDLSDAYEIPPEEMPRPLGPGLPAPPPPPNPLDRFFGDYETALWLAYGVLLTMNLALIALVGLIMRMKESALVQRLLPR